ncbi:MAG: hypothetical protein HY744_23615 [Deltaproteobacteria bacterium]|nr:hypothetical protein [Deltaproteobacteria bacterium]
MRDPGRLVNNALLRALVARLGFRVARALVGHALVPLVVGPARRRHLRHRVHGYLGSYFPALGARAQDERAREFLRHYRAKLAEDCIALNIAGLDRFLDVVLDRVRYEGAEHFVRALYAPAGILAVGAHVGSPTLGTAALLPLFLRVPPERYRPVRLCIEPEAERYPELTRNLEGVLREYGGDLGFVPSGTDTRRVAGEMGRCLAQGGLVTTNLDVLAGGASERTFLLFGRARVRLPALVGAAKLALRSGALVLPWVNLRTPEGFRLVLEPPIGPVPQLGEAVSEEHPETVALCEKLRSVLEGWIAAQPEQWFYWDRFHQRLVRDSP